ncbi:MAG: signal peptidase I [Acidobacteriota bacterium]
MVFGLKKRTLKYIFINIFSAAIISVLLFIYLFSPYKVIGNSMSPVLKSGEKVIISTLLPARKIDRFDIVVIKPPGMNGKKLIKRVIGLPGELIQIKSGDVLINDSKIAEPFLLEKGDVMFRSINMKPENIPSDSYFFLGDNREKSTDSRNFGSLNRKKIIGRIILRYWPFTKLGFIK